MSDSATSLIDRALSVREQGDFDQAIQNLQSAVEIEPDCQQLSRFWTLPSTKGPMNRGY
jgi:Tfp pilus assembly protein PilF